MINSVCSFVWYRIRIGIYGNVYPGSRVGSGRPGFGFGCPRQAPDLTFEVISRLSEICGSRYALGKISSLTIKYSFNIKLPL